jgi:sulfoxide reductase heme-binding subunit YedZ
MALRQQQNTVRPDNAEVLLWRILIGVLVAFLAIGSLFVGSIFEGTQIGQSITAGLNWLFAADSVQLWWYVTRAAGIMAYLLLWFSTVWGLAVTSKIFDPLLDRIFTYDFHQFISLLAIGFILLHVLVLTVDRYLPYSTWQILIPFLSPYRPLWVGIGVIAFYIILLVTVTFYIRGRIGMRAFRIIHISSLLGYLGVTLHGLYAGTDSPLLAMQLIYEGTGLVVIFLTVHWLTVLYQRRLEKAQAVVASRSLRNRHRAIR